MARNLLAFIYVSGIHSFKYYLNSSYCLKSYSQIKIKCVKFPQNLLVQVVYEHYALSALIKIWMSIGSGTI